MSLPRPTLPDNNLLSYIQRLRYAVRRYEAGDSDSTYYSTGPSGTVFEVQESALSATNFWHGFEEYVDGNPYSLYAVVYVTTGKTYVDADGNSFYSVPGIYICRSPVPPKSDLTSIGNPHVKAFLDGLSQDEGVVYAPVFVPNDSRPLSYLTEKGNGKFWELIAPLTTVDQSCQDGMGVTTYIAMQKSGSI